MLDDRTIIDSVKSASSHFGQADFIMVYLQTQTYILQKRMLRELKLSDATGQPSENQFNFLTTIRSNVNRMATLVSDLADISVLKAVTCDLSPGLCL